MKSLIVIVIGVLISWHYTDIMSDVMLAGVVANFSGHYIFSFVGLLVCIAISA